MKLNRELWEALEQGEGREQVRVLGPKRNTVENGVMGGDTVEIARPVMRVAGVLGRRCRQKQPGE